MPQLLVSAVVLVGAFTQSLAGFGVALVTMALLPGLIGLQTAAPLVALIALALEVILLARYGRSMRLRPVLQIAGASALTVPLGMFFLRRLDERLALALLGLVIGGYALYALFDPPLPKLHHPAWAYAAGLVAGLLGGAYNTSGPPVIIYGHCRLWPPPEFKGNLQGFFLFNSAFIVLGHWWNGGFTPQVWRSFFDLLPVIAVGIVAGLSLDRVIQPDLFRKIILYLLILLGLRLLLVG
jgi:uncharacterized protein